MSEWQPIESAPKDGRQMLLFVPWKLNLPDIEVGAWSMYAHSWLIPDRQCGGDVECEPTHWMPIPDAPK